MSSLLAEARTKTITKKLFDNILDELANQGSVSMEDNAYFWWQDNKTEIIGLSVAEAISIFNAAKKRKDLSSKYDELVASMSWKEKIEFLSVGLKQLKNSNSKKLRTMALIGALVEAAPKIISVILMVV